MEDFETVYAEYFDLVFGFVLSLCQNEALAEEVTQESFFKALKNIHHFRGDCRLNVWLCQIAKNTLNTELKKRKRFGDGEAETRSLSDHETPENILIKKETERELHDLLHDLAEPYKEVFWMRTFGELSFREIGEMVIPICFFRSKTRHGTDFSRARRYIRNFRSAAKKKAQTTLMRYITMQAVIRIWNQRISKNSRSGPPYYGKNETGGGIL